MTKTEHYQLNQWDAADPVRREDFNADNAAVEAALRSIRSEAAEGLQALAGNVSASLGSGGQNCRVVCGSYTGTGTYGQENPNVLNFGFYPVLVLIGSGNNCGGPAWPTIMLRGVGGSTADNNASLSGISVTWTNTGVSWWNYYNAENQNNGKIAYYYVALGYSKA